MEFCFSMGFLSKVFRRVEDEDEEEMEVEVPVVVEEEAGRFSGQKLKLWRSFRTRVYSSWNTDTRFPSVLQRRETWRKRRRRRRRRRK